MDFYLDKLLQGFPIENLVEQIVIEETVKEKRKEVSDTLQSNGYTPEESTELSSQIISLDPTTRSGSHDYVDKIVSWVADRKVILPEDYETTKQTLRQFFKMKNKLPSLKGKEIGDFNSPGEIQKQIDSGKKKTKKQNRVESFEKIASEGEYTVWKVSKEDQESFCKLAQGTQWCVKDPKYFNQYKPPYYYVSKGSEPFVLLHVDSDQLKDVYDDRIKYSQYIKIKSLIEPIIKRERGGLDGLEGDLVVASPIEEFSSWTMAELQRYLKFLDIVPKDFEKEIIQNPKEAVAYAERIRQGRWPEAEPYILKDPQAIVHYADYVIQWRWREGEEVLLNFPDKAVKYAEYVIQDRWPEAEPYILKDVYATYSYISGVIRKRWPEAEDLLKQYSNLWNSYQKYL